MYHLSGARSMQYLDGIGYGLFDQGLIPGKGNDGNFFLHHGVHTGSRAHPACYSMGIGVSYRGGKAAGA